MDSNSTNSSIGKQYPSIPLKTFRVEWCNPNALFEQQRVGFQNVQATREEDARARFSNVYSSLQITDVKEVSNG